MKLLLSSLALYVTLSSTVFAEEPPPSPGVLQTIPPDTFAVDYVFSLPLGKVPGQGPWSGVRAEWDFNPSPFGFELGYAYRGKQFYSYDHSDQQWVGPLPWQLVDSGSVSDSDWPFFQTRHMFSPGLVFRGHWMEFRPRLALDMLLQFYVPGGATEYYPDYNEQFHKYLGTGKTVFGNSLRMGIGGALAGWLDYGADFVFEIPDWSQFYDAVQNSLSTYAQTNAHFELSVGIRL